MNLNTTSLPLLSVIRHLLNHLLIYWLQLQVAVAVAALQQLWNMERGTYNVHLLLSQLVQLQIRHHYLYFKSPCLRSSSACTYSAPAQSLEPLGAL